MEHSEVRVELSLNVNSVIRSHTSLSLYIHALFCHLSWCSLPRLHISSYSIIILNLSGAICFQSASDCSRV